MFAIFHAADAAKAFSVVTGNDINIIVCSLTVNDDFRDYVRFLSSYRTIPDPDKQKLIFLGRHGEQVIPETFDLYSKLAFHWFTGQVEITELCVQILRAALSIMDHRLKPSLREAWSAAISLLEKSVLKKELQLMYVEMSFRTILINIAKMDESVRKSPDAMVFVHCRHIDQARNLAIALGAISFDVIFTYCPDSSSDIVEDEDVMFNRLSVCDAKELMFVHPLSFVRKLLDNVDVFNSERVMFIPTPNYVRQQCSESTDGAASFPTLYKNGLGLGMLWGTDLGAYTVEYADEAVFSVVPASSAVSFRIPWLASGSDAPISAEVVPSYWGGLRQLKQGIVALCESLNRSPNADEAVRELRRRAKAFARDAGRVRREIADASWFQRYAAASGGRLAEFEMLFAVCSPTELENHLSEHGNKWSSTLFPALYALRLKGEIELERRKFYVLVKIQLPK